MTVTESSCLSLLWFGFHASGQQGLYQRRLPKKYKYICSRDPSGFVEFAQSLLRYMFGQHDTIIFEADDTDWAAMEVIKLFAARNEATFDTYVYLNLSDEHATL